MELGFIDEVNEDEKIFVDKQHECGDYVQWRSGVIGGYPSELLPGLINNIERNCRYCNTHLKFLCQIYAPVDDINPSAFHRSLYVFFCPNGDCVSKHLRKGNLYCYRMQLPQKNPYYVFDPDEVSQDDIARKEREREQIFKAEMNKFKENGNSKVVENNDFVVFARQSLCVESVSDEQAGIGAKDTATDIDDDDDDDNEEEGGDKEAEKSNAANGKEKTKDKEGNEIKAMISKCAVCAKETSQRCSRCKCVYYCSVDHQKEHWTKEHKKYCKMLAEAVAKEEEQEKSIDKDLNQKDLDAIAANNGKDDKTAKMLERGKDKNFMRFLKVTSKEPSQVLRYCRWPDRFDVLSVAPLWVSTKGVIDVETDIPKCENCGSKRKFEFQILPQMLTKILELEKLIESGSEKEKQSESFASSSKKSNKNDKDKKELDIDFGSIYVFTCTKSCDIKSKSFVQEFCIAQSSST